jgi:hypothetical protein
VDKIPHRKELLVFLAVVAFTWLSFARDLSHWNHGNVWSRIGLTFAVVEHGTFSIDAYVSQTQDWSQYDGHYYSNKAPAPALLAVPFYFAQVQIQRLFGVEPDDPRSRNVAVYVANVVGAVVPTLLALVLLWLVLLRRFELPPLAAFAILTAWALGSLGFLYGLIFFGHQSAAAFFTIGMCLSLLEVERSDGARTRPLFWAGLAMGLAVASDFVSAQFVAVWTGWLWWRTRGSHRRWELWRAWILGGAGPAFCIILYDKICFGSILSTPYTDGIINPQWAALNTLAAPSLDRLAEVTVRPWRGILYCTPVFALVLVGLDQLRRASRPELWAAAIGVVGHFVYLSALPSSFGGFCVGPRYATSALPLALLLLVPAVKLTPRLFGALTALSATLMLVAALTDPLPHQQIRDPYREYLVPMLLGDARTAGQWSLLASVTTLEVALLGYLAIWAALWLWLRRRLRAAA